MRPSSRFAVLAAAAGLCLGSCSNTSVNTATIEGANPGQYLVCHGSLGRTIQLQNYNRRDSNGLMEVQVELKNNSSSDVAVEYAFEWFDAQGFKIETPLEHWTPATLNGQQVRVVGAIAPRTGASKFQIHVRYPHEVTR